MNLLQSIFREFRDFAIKGNVVDLAVGVIIGAAFGGIVNSLVSDVLMPPIGRVAGNLDFSNLYIPLSAKVSHANREYAATQPSVEGKIIGALDPSRQLPLDEAKKIGPVIAYGRFFTNLINFIIVAFCVFLMVKLMNAARRRFDLQQAAAPSRMESAVLEIRDMMKQKEQGRGGSA